jgi:hypothetical protein
MYKRLRMAHRLLVKLFPNRVVAAGVLDDRVVAAVTDG